MGYYKRIRGEASTDTLKAIYSCVRPPRKLTVSSWADQYRILGVGKSASPGPWRTALTEYLREIMDAFNDPLNRRIIFMASAQLGKTEFLNNVIGYHIAEEPCPILCVQPTVPTAKTYSRLKLTPMFEDTPCLRHLVDNQGKNEVNTVLQKTFPSGSLTVVGTKSAASLTSLAIRLLILDEVDRFEGDVGGEGDPFNLAVKRTTTYGEKAKILAVSTPTVRGQSRIEKEFLKSDQRYYYLPCDFCQYEQRLVWGNVRWERGDPATAGYRCESCEKLLSSLQIKRMVKRGQWRATQPFQRIAGFHLSQLYSPFSTLEEMVTEFLQAKSDPQQLKTFINTTLGELWEEKNQGEILDENELMKRREKYRAFIPEGVLLLVAGVDVQKDHLACLIMGFGADQEAWCLKYLKIPGPPSLVDTWERLDKVLSADYQHQLGPTFGIRVTMVDTGNFTEEVYEYLRRKRNLNKFIHGIKGVEGGLGQGLITKVSTEGERNTHRLPITQVCNKTAKDLIFYRLQYNLTGAKSIHFPLDLERDFFDELSAEVLKKVISRGREVYRWEKRSASERNEALDCMVYCFAAMRHFRPVWEEGEANLKKRVEEWQEEQKAQKKEEPEYEELPEGYRPPETSGPDFSTLLDILH